MLYLQFVTLNTSNATDFATELSLREIRHGWVSRFSRYGLKAGCSIFTFPQISVTLGGAISMDSVISQVTNVSTGQ